MAEQPQPDASGLSPERAGAASSSATPERAQKAGVLEFFRASWAELQRVRWPDGRQVAQGTTVVIVFTIIAGIVLGLVDAGAARLIDLII